MAPVGKRIGDILIDMGACTQEEINRAVAEMDGLLGEALVEMGVITRGQLEIALMRQEIDLQAKPSEMRRMVHEQSTQLFIELGNVNQAVRGLTLQLAKKNGS